MRDGRLGNYRVVSCIGEGGMGTVYRVEHTLLGRAAAIKVLQPELSQNQDMIARFFNEARATAQLRHPGIVDVFDFGTCEDGAAFIVMELLQGESLTSRIAREGRLAWPQACHFARQIASALAAAHRAQIVHRDLKPDNVFLVTEPDRRDERTKVLDFGIAKLADAGSRGSVKTRADLIMGTPAYMSPQQCRGAGQVDHRADIYSLGCILFEMVCGRPPFVGEGFGDLLSAHMMIPPPAPRGLAPELPEALAQLILHMLAKSEADRPSSMEAVAIELDAIAEASGEVAGSVARLSTTLSVTSGAVARGAAVTTFGGSAGQVVVATATRSPRRRLPYVFAAAAAVSMAGTFAVTAVYRDQPAGAPTEQATVAASTSPVRPPEPSPPPPSPPPSEPLPRPPEPAPPLPEPAPPRPTVPDQAGPTPAVVERAPRPVVHELACDPGCEVVLDGEVVGKAGPGSPYRGELVARAGQVRTYVLRPIDKAYRQTSYRAPADRSVKTTIHLPCAPRVRQDASVGPRIYNPYDPCRRGEP